MSAEVKTFTPAPSAGELPLIDTVFHLTAAINRLSILENGLQPNPERGKEESWRRLEQFMDDIRPEHVHELGISRRQGVFAYPDIEVLKPRYVSERNYDRLSSQTQRDKDDTVFAIDVDPNKVMVFDMEDLAGIQQRLIYGHRTEQYAKAVKNGLIYWNNGLTLDEFRKFYESEHNSWTSDWTLREEFREGHHQGQRFKFWTPEIIVPGPIVGDSLRWAASKLTLRYPEE